MRETNILGHSAMSHFASVPWLRHKLSTCSAVQHQVATKQTGQPRSTAAPYLGSGSNNNYCHIHG